MPKKASLTDKFRHAFAVGDEYEAKLDEDELALLEGIAEKIYRRGLAPVAIPFILFNKPLNVLGANFVQMGEIFLTTSPMEEFLKRLLGKKYSHELLVRTLEKRQAIERLVEMIEARCE